MPTVRIIQRIPFPRELIFALFSRPATHVALAPEGMRIQLIQAPEIMDTRSRIVVRIKRYGITQQLVTEIVDFLSPDRIVEEQRQGPFSRWKHTREFIGVEGETELIETIEFEQPTGLLGLTLTAARIEADIHAAYLGREQRIAQLLVSLA